MIPLIFATALQSEIVLQSNVVETLSCGLGCYQDVEQLTPMVEIGNGWRKIKVRHTPYLLNSEGVWEQKLHRERSGNGMSTHWNYSNCGTNMFTRRSKEYFSAPPKSKHPFEQNLNAFLSNGKPNFSVVCGQVFQRWRAMCPETEAERKGTEEVRGSQAWR